MRPRIELETAINEATKALPKRFHTSPAAGDYTFHIDNSKTLSLGIRDMFRSEPQADLELPIAESREHFLKMLAQGPQDVVRGRSAVVRL